jgi:hypothetical protein
VFTRVPAAQNLNSGATQRHTGTRFFIGWLVLLCCEACDGMANSKNFCSCCHLQQHQVQVSRTVFFRFPRDPKRFVYYDVCMRRLEYGGLRTFAHVPACQPIDRSKPFAIDRLTCWYVGRCYVNLVLRGSKTENMDTHDFR